MTKTTNNRPDSLMLTGFVLFLCGSALAVTLKTSTLFQIIGVVLMILAAGLFGTSIAGRLRQ